jgi:Divergent InlB B-repeat domain
MNFNRPVALVAACLTLALGACGGGGGSDDGSAADVQLAVTVIGPTTPAPAAQGRVTSQPAGIDCLGTCTATFAIDTVVMLTAAAPAGQRFSAWSGACSGAAASCTVTMSASRAVTATFAAASGNAAWTDAVAVSGSGAGSPRVVIDSAGNATAVWLQLDATGKRDLWSSRRGPGAAWSTPALLESSANEINDPELAIDAASGRAMVVWWEINGAVFDVWARPADANGAWGTAARIDSQDRQVAYPRVGMDASGNAIVTWNQIATSNNWNVWSSRYANGSWGAAVRITDDRDLDLNPQLAVAGTGDAFVVWRRFGGGIWASRASGGGAWSAPTLLALGTTSLFIDFHQIVADAAGNATAVWSQVEVQSGQTSSTLVSKRFAGGGWSATAAPVATPIVGNFQSDSRLAVNTQGVVAAAWGRLDNSAWANQMRSDGTWATAAPIKAAGAGALSSVPVIAIDDAGDMLAAWTVGNLVDGVPDLWINRFVQGSGWAGATAHENEPNTSFGPRIAMNARGNAALAWQQNRGSGVGTLILSREFTSGR